jgi:hypothetical protein
MRFPSWLLAAALLAAPAATAHAQDESTVPEELLGMVGEWRLEQEDQNLPICALTFTDQESIGGWAVELPQPCPPPFPPADAMTTWSVDSEDGSVLILDLERNVTLRLLEDEDGLFVTPEGQLPAFYLMLPWDAEGTGGEMGDDLGD